MIMLGGGKKVETILKGEDSDISMLTGIVLLIFLFILRALVVQMAYNKIAPKLIGNWSSVHDDNREFKPLNFEEALLFTILISFLFM